MKIVNPSVKLLDTTNSIANIAYAARVCYATQDKEHRLTDLEFINNVLIPRKHIYMLRHGTFYLKVYESKADERIGKLWQNSFCTDRWLEEDGTMNIVANGQCIYEAGLWNEIFTEEWKEKYLEGGLPLTTIKERANERFSFEVVTQISTSRELNRVSPNNISEQSTRYVEVGTICKPHLLYLDKEEISDEDLIEMRDDHNIGIILYNYLLNTKSAFDSYNKLKEYGLPQQDARGVLPLDTMTRCVYTYSVKEWKQILNLRYFEKTGKAHPNAKIIATMIYNELCQLGYKDYLDAE